MISCDNALLQKKIMQLTSVIPPRDAIWIKYKFWKFEMANDNGKPIVFSKIKISKHPQIQVWIILFEIWNLLFWKKDIKKNVML